MNPPRPAEQVERPQVFERISDAFVALDKDWRYTHVNAKAAELFGRRPEDLIGKHIWTEFPEGISQPFHCAYEKAMAEQQPVFLEEYYPPYDRWFENRIFPAPDGLSIFFHDITARKQAEAMVACQTVVLEHIAAGAPLADTFTAMLRSLEAFTPGLLGSVLLLDEDGVHVRHGAAPSLPDEFNRAVDGQPIGPSAGSCGTAAYRREPVIVEDIATDPLWVDYRALALAHGLRACWSTPIMDQQGRVLGTFAMYYRQAGRPTALHRRCIELATNLAAVAISRHRTDAALLESEARLRLSAEAANVGLWDWDLRTNQVFFSPEWKRQIGYRDDEISNDFSEWQSRIHPDDLEATLQKVRAFAAHPQGRHEAEFRFRHKDGSYRWIYTHGDILRDADSKPTRMLGCHIDITERKQAEAALRRNEEVLRLFVANSPAAIAMFDREMRYIVASRRFCHDYGLGDQIVVGRSHYEVFPEMSERWKEIHRRCLAGVIEKKDEDPFPRADGKVDWVRWEIRPWYEAEGGIGGIILFSEVITGRKQAEEALRERNRFSSALVDTVPAIVYVYDLETQCNVYANDGIQRLLGYSPEAIQGMGAEVFARLIHPDDLPAVLAVQGRLAAGADSDTLALEYRMRHADGNWIALQSHERPFLRDADGAVRQKLGIAIDVTERRQAEQERQKFVLLADSSSEFIGLCDLDLQPLYVNPAGVRLVGLPDMAAACRVKVQDYFFPENQRFITEEFFPRVLREGHGEVEIRFRHFQTGEPIWMLYNVFNVRDPGGRVIGWAAVSRDVTARKRAEQELIASEQRYRALFENMTAGFVLFEVVPDDQGVPVDLIVVAANREFEVVTGLRTPEVIGKRLTQVLPGIEKDSANWIGTYGIVALAGEARQFEQHSERLGRYFSISAYQAGPRQCAVVFLDITARKQAEMALRESEARFRTVLETVALIGLMLDREGRITLCSDYLLSLTGWTRDEVIGQNWFRLFLPEEVCDHIYHEVFLKSLPGGNLPTHYENEIVTRSGERRMIAWSNTFVRDPAGEIVGVASLGEDITDRKRAEAALRLLNAELEQRVEDRTAQLAAKNRELEAFTYAVSHDLKAPLRSIDGYSRLLLEDHAAGLDAEGRLFLENVRRSTLRMGELIDDLLTYSKLERRLIEPEAVDPAALTRAILADHAEEIQARGVRVTVEFPDVKLRADRQGMEMALRNLLDNAFKFTRHTPQPAIAIGGRASATALTLWVRDNGAGFDPKFHERIFEIFQRLHRAEDYPGTGVGLAIVRKALERMGGRAWAESRPGHGAIFYLEVPL